MGSEEIWPGAETSVMQEKLLEVTWTLKLHDNMGRCPEPTDHASLEESGQVRRLEGIRKYKGIV